MNYFAGDLNAPTFTETSEKTRTMQHFLDSVDYISCAQSWPIAANYDSNKSYSV